MAITHAPAIVTNGLILHYDMGNTKKSFKGKPIVNQFEVPTPDGSGNVTFSVQGNGGSFVRVTSGTYGDYTVQPSDIVYSYTVGTNACHYHGMSLASPTISPGSYVTFSFDYYISPTCVNYGVSPNQHFLANIEIYEPTSPNWTYLTGASYYDADISVVGVWKTKYATVQVPANSTNPQVRCYMYPGACSSTRLADSGFILYRNPQAEVNGFRTPFVNGTRTNTQAILNLANPYETQNYMPYPYASYNGSSFELSYNKSDLGATYTYQTSVANPVNAPGVLQYYTGTGGYQFFAIRSNTVPTTAKYTFSYYARLISGSSSSNIGNSQIWRQSILGSDSAMTGDVNPTFTTTWKRYSVTGNITAGNGIDMFLVHTSGMIAGITMQFCGFQLEPYPKLTPFSSTTGTSSTTNTFTASSLTYASDNAFSFNGSSDYVTSNFTGNFSSGFTADIIFKCTTSSASLSTYRRMLILNNATSTFYGILLEPDGRGITFDVPSTTTRYSPAANYAITANTIYHLTCVWDNWNYYIYINGALITNNSIGSGSTPDVTSIVLGGNTASNYFPGTIYSCKIYKNALSSAEVLQNFNALRGRYGL
jgi:hypothetical protein